MVVTFLAFFLYVLLQYPAEKVLTGFKAKYLSEDKLLEKYHYFDQAREVA